MGYQTKAAVLILGIVCFLLTAAAAALGSPPEVDQSSEEAQPLQEAGNTANATADAAETPEVPAGEPAVPGASSHEPRSGLEATGKEPAGSEAVGAAVPASKKTAHEPRGNAAIRTTTEKPAAKKAEPLTDESPAEVGKRTPTRAEPKPTPKALTHAKVAELKKANPGLISRIISATKGLVRRALSWLGARYIWGGISPRGVDCSGLTRLLYLTEGVELPHSAKQQFELGQAVARASLLPGDLVFFNTRGPISHVGIYIGNGEFIHASNPRRGVRVDSLSSDYYRKRFAGARRYKSFG